MCKTMERAHRGGWVELRGGVMCKTKEREHKRGWLENRGDHV